jgi:hypothetical protein
MSFSLAAKSSGEVTSFTTPICKIRGFLPFFHLLLHLGSIQNQKNETKSGELASANLDWFFLPCLINTGLNYCNTTDCIKNRLEVVSGSANRQLELVYFVIVTRPNSPPLG